MMSRNNNFSSFDFRLQILSCIEVVRYGLGIEFFVTRKIKQISAFCLLITFLNVGKLILAASYKVYLTSNGV